MAWTSLSGNKAIVKKPYLEQEIKLLPAGSKWFSSYIWISLKFDLTREGHRAGQNEPMPNYRIIAIKKSVCI